METKTKKYLVNLIPHDKFFFGGERTFGQKTDDNDKTNYFVTSNYYPQQTALLGFIRHQLLLQSNDFSVFKDNKIQDKEKAAKLIDFSSFTIGKKFPYGKIHSLSPVFILKKAEEEKHDYYFPANKEYQYYKKFDDNCKEIEVKEFLELEIKNGSALLLKYDPKYDFSDFLTNKANDLKKYNEVFIEHKQVGIRKKYHGGTDEDAYYIQVFYKFKEGYCFAFVVELEEDVKFNNQPIVVFGGEQQSFTMEVNDFKTDFATLIPDYKPSKYFDKVVLVSDAYVENNDVLAKSDFANTETIDFRFLSTITEKGKNYYNEPDKSNKYNLFKKGSVFYGNISVIEQQLKNPIFEKLGYNKYKPIKKLTL